MSLAMFTHTIHILHHDGACTPNAARTPAADPAHPSPTSRRGGNVSELTAWLFYAFDAARGVYLLTGWNLHCDCR
jgi:hypothetical protein